MPIRFAIPNLPFLLSWDDAQDYTELAHNRVERGVALLDHAAPDWREYVHTGTLDMRSTTDCVRGQLVWHHPNGGAIGGTISLYGGDEFPPEFGFEYDPDAEQDSTEGISANTQYEILGQLWTEAITGGHK